MFENAIKVIKKLEKSGFKAYIVGGYVRDKYLSISSADIDICTSAKPNEILKVFKQNVFVDERYGAAKLTYKNNSYDITTFRKDIEYDDSRRPSKIEYVNSLEEDLIRRDFTINTLCIDSNKKIIDIYGGKKDIDNKILRTIRNSNITIREDSLRILRAIRFASILNFKIDGELEEAIKINKRLLKELSFYRKRSELELIFKSDNYKRGIDLINRYMLLNELEINNVDNIKKTTDVLGMWSQINYSDKYPFSNLEKEKINDIRQLTMYGKIDSYAVYKYGKLVSITAGEILGVELNEIEKIYKNLKIYSIDDIKINMLEVSEMLNVRPGEKIRKIISDLEYKILSNEIENEKEKLIEYIFNNYGGDKDER